jgi:hypothetical protein
MKFFISRTAKPKQFTYKARYYDPEKEAWEQKKATAGVKNTLEENEQLKARMQARWHRDELTGRRPYSRIIFMFYGVLILTVVYLVFFTDFIENILRAFKLT